MRRIVSAFTATLAGVIMLFSYHTSTNSTEAAANAGTTPAESSASSSSASGTSSTTDSSSAGSDTSSDSSSTDSSSTNSSSNSGTFTGDSVDTQWGPVQVKITVENGKITSSEAVVYPTENPRDQEINSYAVPTLNQAVVDAQSANIDMVSGATVTSNGYISSLQSALDQANL